MLSSEPRIAPSSASWLSAESGEDIPIDTWTLAYWTDGSVKWGGIAGVIPAGTEKLTLEKAVKKSKAKSKLPDTDKKKSVSVAETSQGIHISTGVDVYKRQGYAWDMISDKQLLKTNIEKEMIVTPGAAYKTVLVSAAQYIPRSEERRVEKEC